MKSQRKNFDNGNIKMKILISGATGFVGSYLIPALLAQGDEVVVITRDPGKAKPQFNPAVAVYAWEQLDQINPAEIDAVINLSGENIGAHRWNSTIKQEIIQSRVRATERWVDWILSSEGRKPHLYNASAIGIYGLQELGAHAKFKEKSALIPPHDFLGEVGQAWEHAADKAIAANVPVTFLRFGVILKSNAGMLKKLELSYKLGLGMYLGSGEQNLSWVHVDDVVQVLQMLLAHSEMVGAYNIVAPETVTQRKFAKTLASVLGKPIFLTMPDAAVKLLFGEMGSELLLGSQAVVPERLLEAGYRFKFPTLQEALSHEYKK